MLRTADPFYNENMKKNDPYVTESRLQAILDESFKKFAQSISGDIGGIISDLATHIDNRFNVVEADVKDIKNILEQMGYDNQSRDDKLVRHERWHYQAAKKLQIKLTQ